MKNARTSNRTPRSDRRSKNDEVSPRKRNGKAKTRRPLSRATSCARAGMVQWLERSDKRGPVARRFRDLCIEVANDIEPDGGLAALSETKRQIIRRIAMLSVWCESQEAKAAEGEEINVNEFQRVSNSLRRLCESIGLDRVAKDITPPNPLDYARRYDEEAVA